MRCGARKDLYHIEFFAKKYIDFAVRQKYRIAKQYIDKTHPKFGWVYLYVYVFFFIFPTMNQAARQIHTAARVSSSTFEAVGSAPRGALELSVVI